ncbi:hypothetical protein LTR20_006077 [Exophiala xenobiotica]|nr:hypothetical protein LTS06_009370 [Exophiala xenobiotica]KAK5356758.1 hypothetical protein LTR61_000493 [Exophiala xenobiotica]KAK5376910.1 hypothetical protein LTR11_004574 [Exophiala xenobiotica]KAK5406720.1 hypothetical protein LTR06_008214 [Exophiala xenobiotica]KAK5462128.1 hypothetical protein LTR20_006077 [Exophiala xenobiotica]
MARSAVLLTLCAVLAMVLAGPTGHYPGPHSPKGFSPPWGQPPWGQCNNRTMQIRKDFNKATPQERKEYTDAINCVMTFPSNLNGAINRYFDYATVHINLTQVVHLDGFFLVWHRMYVHLFEQDMRQNCGFRGPMLYWNWPATAADIDSTPIFNGDEYSMSGNGEYINAGPYQVGPNFTVPHGSGGGCVTSGPFANHIITMQPSIDPLFLLTGEPLPQTVFLKNESCLTRDLNSWVAQKFDNWTRLEDAINCPDQACLASELNGAFGGADFGLHGGAHFAVGPPESNIFVSVQDPIWWPLHTMLDNIYVQWQKRHPEIADQLYGTMTANNVPPSANATLDSWTPDWGYFGPSMQIKDLISTTAGPFCYDYEWEDGPYTE